MTPTRAATPMTPTVTPLLGPAVIIGSVHGAPGSQVTVPISLTKNGPNIVTVAPLILDFDPNVLSFVSCSRAAGVSTGKSVSTGGTPSTGQVTVALSGDLMVIPDGDMIDCNFTINANAPLGPSALTFVSVDLADVSFNDYFASGTNGAVTVN
jgi:hypothetical protein